MENSILDNKLNLAFFLITLFYVLYLGDPTGYYFLNDDFIHIPQAANMNFMNDSSFVRPVSNFSLWLDYIIWEKNAYGYHLTNLLIHVINVVLVFFCTKFLYKNFGYDNNWLDKSLICCTIFLVYANHSESIFWIIGRGSSLTTLFFLSALICFLKAENSFINTTLCLLSFYLGLFTYELIWIFPLVVTLYNLFLKNNYLFKVVLAIWVSFIIFFIIKLFILENAVSFYELGAFNTFSLKSLFYNFNTLFSRVFLPPLSNSIVFLIIYLIFIFGLAILILKNKHNRLLLFSFFGILISILPVLSLGIDTHDTESERFIYLSTFFAVILIVEIVQLFKRHKWIILISFLSIHFFYLNEASKTYKTASLIVKNSLLCINSEEKFDSIHIYNLPSQYKGALIFRKGFEEAFSWIITGNYNNITIYSRQEVYKEKVELICIEYDSIYFKYKKFENQQSVGEKLILHKFNNSNLIIDYDY